MMQYTPKPKDIRQKKEPIKKQRGTLSLCSCTKAVRKEFRALKQYGTLRQSPIIYS